MKFAQINEDNIVVNLVEIADTDCLDSSGNPSEEAGEVFCSKVLGEHLYRRTENDGSIRKRPAIIGGGYDPVTDAFSNQPQPGPWASLSSNGRWVSEFPINIHTGEPLTDEEFRYIAYYIRNTKSYRFCPAVPKNPNDPFLSIACTSNDFMYPTFEGLMYGSNRTQEIAEVKIDGGKITIPFVHTLRKEVDITPIGIVLEVRWEGLNPDIAAASLNAHPQTASRTRHELFRLIIEWAYAHTALNNNEPAAVTCHDILRTVQMPLSVRNELLTEVPPQAVECYLRGQFPFSNTSFETLEDPPAPPLFTAWYKSLMETYPPLIGQTGVTIRYAQIPKTYPM